MHVSTYQKIGLHLPRFWGKIVLFKATCQKNKSVKLNYISSFLTSFNSILPRLDGGVLTFLLLLVSGDGTALRGGFPVFVPLLSLLRYSKNYSSCPSHPPITPLTHFLERRWRKDWMKQRCSSCLDGHGKKLAIPFAFSRLGARNLNTGKNSWLFRQFQHRLSSVLDGRKGGNEKLPLKDNYHVTFWHVGL